MDQLATFKAYLDRWLEARASEPINQPFMCVRVVRDHLAQLIAGKGNKKRALLAIDHAARVFAAL